MSDTTEALFDALSGNVEMATCCDSIHSDGSIEDIDDVGNDTAEFFQEYKLICSGDKRKDVVKAKQEEDEGEEEENEAEKQMMEFQEENDSFQLELQQSVEASKEESFSISGAMPMSTPTHLLNVETYNRGNLSGVCNTQQLYRKMSAISFNEKGAGEEMEEELAAYEKHVLPGPSHLLSELQISQLHVESPFRSMSSLIPQERTNAANVQRLIPQLNFDTFVISRNTTNASDAVPPIPHSLLGKTRTILHTSNDNNELTTTTTTQGPVPEMDTIEAMDDEEFEEWWSEEADRFLGIYVEKVLLLREKKKEFYARENKKLDAMQAMLDRIESFNNIQIEEHERKTKKKVRDVLAWIENV